jgi:hypothetical protein
LPLIGPNNLLTIQDGGFVGLTYICNMQVDNKLISHLAHLSRLNVAPEKMDKLVDDMQDLVLFVEKLNELDNDNLLYLYGLYKQITCGDCNVSKPSFFDLKGQA